MNFSPLFQKAAAIILYTLSLFICLPSSVWAAVRIAVMVSSDSPPYIQALSGLEEKLQQIRPEPGLHIYQLNNEIDLALKNTEEIKAIDPQIIITLGALALTSAAESIKDIPIVAGIVLSKDIIESHRNATGVVLDIPLDTQFVWMKKFFPTLKNIGVIFNPEQNESIIKKAVKQAEKNGFNLIAQPVYSPRHLPEALDKLNGNIEVLWGLSDTVVLNKKTAKNLLLFSFRNKVPFVGLSEAWVKAGAYYSLDRNYQDIGGQCAEIAKKILKGTAVEKISPSFPRQITYYVNSRTAKKMKMKIDQSLKQKASKVF